MDSEKIFKISSKKNWTKLDANVGTIFRNEKKLGALISKSKL